MSYNSKRLANLMDSSPNIIAKYLYKVALRVLVITISASAMLGIFALLRRDLDDWSAKSVFSTLLISASSLLVIGNSISLEKRSSPYLLVSLAGIISSISALAICLDLIWNITNNPELWKLFGSFAITSTACTHSSLLSLLPLPRKYNILHAIATSLALTLSFAMIWSIWSGSWFLNWRVTGIIAVCLGSITILIPIISRLMALSNPVENNEVQYCPGCGENAIYEGTQTKCTKCKKRFVVQLTKRTKRRKGIN